MTKEQYEGTPELIFYCEYNPDDFEDRLEIPFTNEYEIKLDLSSDEDNHVCINIDLQPKESNIPKGFFGKNVLNVSAIAGKNGVGKTNVIRRVCSDSGIFGFESIKLYLLRDSLYIDASNYEQRIANIASIASYNGIAKTVVIANVQFPERISRQGFLKKFSATNTKDSLYKILSTSVEQIILGDFVIQKSQPVAVNLYDIKIFSNNQLFGRYYDQLKKLGIDLEATDIGNSNIKEEFLSYSILKFIYDSIVVQSDQRYSEYLGEIFNGCKNIEDLLNNIMKSNESFFNDQLGVENSRISIQRSKIKLHDLYQLFKSIDDNRYFVYQGRLKVNIDTPNEEEREIFNRLVSMLIGLKSGYDIIKETFSLDLDGYSAGEKFLLRSFAFLEDVLDDAMRRSVEKFNSVIILLDEYEQHLHPEWSRKYLSYLLKFLDAEGGRLGIKFQVILTTHSPYLISDLPKENIILLEKDEETGKRTARKSNYGFASNYYDIMSDSFFLDDTIGEFAKQKINSCIQVINSISDDLDKLASDELSLFVENSLKTIEEQNKIIDLVGDKFIQKQLQQLSDSVKQRLFAHSDNSVRKQHIEQEIAELEEKLRQKKMELKND